MLQIQKMNMTLNKWPKKANSKIFHSDRYRTVVQKEEEQILEPISEILEVHNDLVNERSN
jgi:hypothetical protein